MNTTVAYSKALVSCLLIVILLAAIVTTGCRSTKKIGVYDVVYEDASLGWCTVRLLRSSVEGKSIRFEVLADNVEIVQTDVTDDNMLINSTARLREGEYESINVKLNSTGTWKVFRGVVGETGSLEVLYDDTERNEE